MVRLSTMQAGLVELVPVRDENNSQGVVLLNTVRNSLVSNSLITVSCQLACNTMLTVCELVASYKPANKPTSMTENCLSSLAEVTRTCTCGPKHDPRFRPDRILNLFLQSLWHVPVPKGSGIGLQSQIVTVVVIHTLFLFPRPQLDRDIHNTEFTILSYNNTLYHIVIQISPKITNCDFYLLCLTLIVLLLLTLFSAKTSVNFSENEEQCSKRLLKLQ